LFKGRIVLEYSVRQTTAVGRLYEWLEASSPHCSLAVGATCGCDLSHLQREICEALNEIREFRGCPFTSFDHQDVRHLAGQPNVRRFVIERASLGDPGYDRWNDHDIVMRSLASIGGLVLGGRAAIDATGELPNVCRVMVAACDDCRDDGLFGRVTLSHDSPEAVVSEIVDAFRKWMVARDLAMCQPRHGLLDPGEAEILLKERPLMAL
jgi:hypothetical protein